MHPSVMAWGRKVLTVERVRGTRVLEAGSYDENGSLREHILSLGPASYLGIDARPGPGVDAVIPAELAYRMLPTAPPAGGHGSFELVVSTEMLEHARHWQAALRSLTQVLRLGGWLVLTTRSPGFPYHGYPEDHWRFDHSRLAAAFEAMRQVESCGPVWDEVTILDDPDPASPGVFVLARRGLGWPSTRVFDVETHHAPTPQLTHR